MLSSPKAPRRRIKQLPTVVVTAGLVGVALPELLADEKILIGLAGLWPANRIIQPYAF
jgi:hypothetical protein